MTAQARKNQAVRTTHLLLLEKRRNPHPRKKRKRKKKPSKLSKRSRLNQARKKQEVLPKGRLPPRVRIQDDGEVQISQGDGGGSRKVRISRGGGGGLPEVRSNPEDTGKRSPAEEDVLEVGTGDVLEVETEDVLEVETEEDDSCRT